VTELEAAWLKQTAAFTELAQKTPPENAQGKQKKKKSD
jgi:hypothetical protein